MDYQELQDCQKGIETVPIKGKQYVMVKDRVKAFRQLFPDGSISTDIVNMDNGVVVVKATVTDPDGKILATGLSYEREGNGNINKTSYIENCETSAIGRALGFLGIGIDDSMGSADEVANAISGQEKVDDSKVQIIREWAQKVGVGEPRLTAYIGSPLEDMTVADYAKLVNKLKATEKKNGQ